MIASKSRFALSVSAAVLALTLAACSDAGDKAEAPSTPAPTTSATETAKADAPVPAVSNETTGATEAVKAPEADGDVDMAKVLEAGPLKEMVLGADDAPVTIVEYMSMTCPHCANFHAGGFKGLEEKYIKAGKVRFILREFPFDPRAAAAIMLARCAPENQFFPMVDVFFQQQRTWATAEDARSALLQISRLAGFTQESFEACLTNQKLLDDINNVRKKAAEEFGVQSTPTFLINGKRYSGDMSIEMLSAIIDPLL